MRKSTIAVLAACAAMLAGLAIPAAAPAAVFPSNVSINFLDRPGPDIFRGRVSSPNNNCIGDRPIRLFRAQPGNDQLIDTDDSEDNGTWDIDVEGDPAPGNYYVRALRVVRGSTVCQAAMSPRIAVAG